MHIHNLAHLGESGEAERLLDKFEMTVVERDARYISYCALKCFTKWEAGDLNDAIKWGKIGQELKKNTHVDTKFDVSHNLALAERDAKLAGIFLEAAKLKWEQVSPPKVAQISALQRQLSDQLPNISRMSKEDIETTFLDWMTGRSYDA